MELLTQHQLKIATDNCPVTAGDKRLKNRTGRGAPEKSIFGDGSFGKYTYYPVGSNKNEPPKSEGWKGACFARWDSIPSHHALQVMSYQNPLYWKKFEYGTQGFYRIAWDTVLRPPFADYLPNFNDLRDTKTLDFALEGRSLMEASLYFRLVRIFNECLTFIHTASLLRHRYVTQPAEVLLAAACLGQCKREEGYTGIPHPASPNHTIGGHKTIVDCMSLVRNFEWASRNGGWQIQKIRRSRDTTGAFSRRYYGHNHYWFGKGTAFRINLDSDAKTKALYNYPVFCSRWGDEADGWAVMDRCVKILAETYKQTKGKDWSEDVEVPMSTLVDQERYLPIARDGARLY